MWNGLKIFNKDVVADPNIALNAYAPNLHFSIRTIKQTTKYAGVKEPSTQWSSAYFGLFRMLGRKYKKISEPTCYNHVDIVGQM